jgi:hypothetical protein
MGQHHRQKYIEYSEEVEYTEIVGFRLWICAGCENGTLEIFSSNDLEVDYHGNDIERRKYFPDRAIFHVENKHFRKIPKKLNNIYRESLIAFNNNIAVLCSIGIRSLIEGICADKNIEGKNLEERINNMVAILPKNIVKNLHSIRFIGNIAAHELTASDTKELKIAIEICEDLLNYLYELDYKSSFLTKIRQEKEQDDKSIRN